MAQNRVTSVAAMVSSAPRWVFSQSVLWRKRIWFVSALQGLSEFQNLLMTFLEKPFENPSHV